MKILLGLMMMFAVACATNTGGDACVGDHCVCVAGEDCTHACTPGAPECHVQGASSPVDVTCNSNAECHVECSSAASCDVDCGGSAECHVTCPATGCNVTKCIGEQCVVTCGALGVATRSGTTATCP